MRGKILRALKGVFLSVVVCICAVIMYGCDRFKTPSFSGDRPDSVYVAKSIEAIENPSFTSVSEVKLFQNKLVDEYSIEESFMSMPEEVLTNVATVCLKKSSSITKKDIVLEYRAGKEVYDNLPIPSQTTQQIIQSAAANDTAREEQQKPAKQVSYRYELDTVDGQPIRTLVKEERTHEK